MDHAGHRWRDEKHAHQGLTEKLCESAKRTDRLVQAVLFLDKPGPLTFVSSLSLLNCSNSHGSLLHLAVSRSFSHLSL